MKIYFTIFCIIALGVISRAQDSIQYRVVFIGDAGEINEEQQHVLKFAAQHILEGKTSVMYLGDNIYPRGIGLPGSKNEEETKKILQSQYWLMRAKGAPVYFVPGNHDWDKSGREGLAKIKRQWEYLDEQGDSLLKLVPPNGCPDPVAINLTDSLVIIAYDSEWWLYSFDKNNPDAECSCQSRRDILVKLDELYYENRHKIILLASHHPFQSYGTHGGVYTLKDHVFPLTAANKNLYIPLPVIGSLYPALRSAFLNPEDLKHPLYKSMQKNVDAVFDSFPNLVHVAGHEHGLQFIKSDQVQVVSGSGAKHTNASKGKYSLFASPTQGYVTVDLLINNTLDFSYYIYDSNKVKKVFSYQLPYTVINDSESVVYKPIKEDSLIVKVHSSYNKPGKFHRFLFGENYREEWATPVKLPVIKISDINGGLKPLQLGGGMQSKSLRLVDKNGKEWVIRSVEKNPDALLPAELKETFARDWLDDITSAQHPFSALIVPPIANAINVAHANPVIGILSPDKSFGLFNRKFSNLVVLLEEREPLGESDNSVKMKKNLQKDNDNTLHGKEVLRARMLDALLGDWDRHEDQWRWYDTDKGKEKDYLAVPRDRDQVFHLTEGVIPKIASWSFVLPTLRNFDADMKHEKWLLYKTRFVNAYPDFQFSREEWKIQAEKVKEAITDSVLEVALQRLPKETYDIRNDELLRKLKSRRDILPDVMDKYYRFTQKIVDIKVSDKNEFVQIRDTSNGNLNIKIFKINKQGEIKDELMDKTYEAKLTKEIRLYLGAGNDSLVLNNKSSTIKLRVIGGADEKDFDIVASKKKVKLYNQQNASSYTGNVGRLKKYISTDTTITTYAETNLYNIWMPLVVVGLNADDGFIFGGGFKLIKQGGFRKSPYSSLHNLMVAHSFSTTAYRVKYDGEWLRAIGKSDITFNALIRAPDNTFNFFGTGNESVYDENVDLDYYRTRFGIYRLESAIRMKGRKSAKLSIGPSFMHYRLDPDDNKNRIINNKELIGTYDSATVDKSKSHLGFVVEYENDQRSSKILPKWGSFVKIRLQAYKGIGEYAADYAQIIPEVALYKSLNAKSTIVLAERFGGAVSIGHPAFYQLATLGGHENLLGFRQYRFIAEHSLYNNVELRIKLTDFANYILPGQFGITGFWDIGRVWEKDENSNKWHNGVGGGIYFAPASMFSFNVVMGYSSEGWYPYITMGMRF